MKLHTKHVDLCRKLAVAAVERKEFNLSGHGLELPLVITRIERGTDFGIPYVEAEFQQAHHPSYVPQAPAPTWNGPEDGLPPVGLEVEARIAVGHYVGATKSDWAKCQVVALTRAYAILRCIGEEFSSDHEVSQELSLVEFRPVRTAEERSKACDEMYGVILSLPKDRQHNRSDICEALYDAGYRKVGQP